MDTQQSTTPFKTRVFSIVVVWAVLGAIYALLAPFTAEAGESLGAIRAESLVKIPLAASLGLASLITQSMEPAERFVAIALLFFGVLGTATLSFKRKPHFYGVLSLQALFLVASLIQASRFVGYWNEHGHG